MDRRLAWLAAAIIAAAWLIGFAAAARAHDPTGYWAREYAAGRAPNPQWWNGLASGKGLCCSFADGKKVEDVDWDTPQICAGSSETGKLECRVYYRIKLHGELIIVPDAAVVTEPNRFGPAVVWPYMDSDGKTQIRCFLPGAGG